MNAEPIPVAVPAQAKPRASIGRRVLRWTIGIFSALVVLLALALGTLRVMLQQVPEYRDQISARLNEATQLDFRFRDLDARWRLYGPEIYVTRAQVFVPNGGPLLAEARAASIGVDLWRVLFRAEMLAGRIRLIEPQIELVRTQEGRLELAGQAALDPRDKNRFSADDLPTGLLEIEGARLKFQDLRKELRPLQLNGVNMSVERDRDEISLEGDVELPERMGGTLEWLGAARGKLDDPESVHWTLELTGREMLLAGWRDFLGEAVPVPLGGLGQVRLTTHLQGSRVLSGDLQVKVKDLVVPPHVKGGQQTRYPVVAVDLSLMRMLEGWRLQGRSIELSTVQHHWTPSTLIATWESAGGQLKSAEVDFDYLQAENLVPLVALADPAPWRDRVLQLAPQGTLRDVHATFAPRENDFPQFKVGARLVSVGFEPMNKAPGLHGLTGRVEGSDTAGELTIDSRKLEFNLPYMFRVPLSADARGALRWARADKQWQVATRGFAVTNAHANAVTDGEINFPGDDQSPILKLDSKFRDAVLVEGWRYLPVNHLKGPTLAWLDHAFLSGRAPQGEFFFDGPTRGFPFREGGGEFRITFPVEGLDLHYQEGWPRVENIAADVEFHNAGLTAIVRKGSANGLSIASGSARFRDFRNAQLELQARGEGDLAAALGYLQGSPIGPRFGKAFMKLRGKGNTAFELDTTLPLTHIDDRKVRVDARLGSGSRLALEGTDHVLEQLEGALRVEDHLVTSEQGLSATYLGGPIQIELAAEATGGKFDDIVRARGQTAAPALLKALNMPEVIKLDGTVDWHAAARFPVVDSNVEGASDREIAVHVDSALKGTEVKLPAPFAKSAAESRQLRLDLQWPTPTETLVRGTYGVNTRAQLKWEQKGETWEFQRGVLRFGDGDVRMPGSGLELRGSLDELNLSDWLALGSSTPESADKQSKHMISEYLRSADLSVRDFELFGFHFPNVSASLLAGERAWSVSVDGPRARGTVLVPYEYAGSEPLTLNLARLSLGDSEDVEADAQQATAPDAQSEEPDPRKWPSVRASIGQFDAWGKRLGFLRAELIRLPEGLRLDSFSTRSGSFETNGSGTWTVTPEGGRGGLKFKLESSNVLETLQDLGYGASLSGKKALLDADLSWTGAPNATIASRLSGRVRIEADGGKLLNVEPGAGRVFGLMSVAALPRRLTLDFSDFLTKGLSYDTIRGDFRLDDGNAFTENLLLKGPAAEIGIVGRTGLASRDYDQTAVVTGSVGNSLPVAGALAGGPAVGAALLLFTQIFKQPLKGIARGYYRITGPWENPTVQRVDKAQGKDAVRTAEGANGAID